MTLFDRWICVDWSAASRATTGSNSIWVADTGGAEGGSPADVTLDNPSTRTAAGALLAERCSSEKGATLVGVDASLSLPATGLDRLVHPGAPWDDLVALIDGLVDDDDANRNNRFAAAAVLNQMAGRSDGPFWGHPPNQRHEGLSATRPPFPWDGQVEEFRACEASMRARRLRVQSTWKLAYQASVGGQFLMVLGWLRRLRQALPQIRVFPFDTGFGQAPRRGEVWVAEVWPGEFDLEGRHPVRDADQVDSTVRRLRSLDHSGSLSPLLQLPGEVDAAIALREGWPVSPALALP